MRHDSQPFSFTLQAALVTKSSDSYSNQGRKFIAQRGRQYLENHIAPPCKIDLGGYLKPYTSSSLPAHPHYSQPHQSFLPNQRFQNFVSINK
jgi:hypothetical protein